MESLPCVYKTLDCIPSVANKQNMQLSHQASTQNYEQQDICQHGTSGPLGSERALKAQGCVQAQGVEAESILRLAFQPNLGQGKTPLDPCVAILAVPTLK